MVFVRVCVFVCVSLCVYVYVLLFFKFSIYFDAADGPNTFIFSNHAVQNPQSQCSFTPREIRHGVNNIFWHRPLLCGG